MPAPASEVFFDSLATSLARSARLFLFLEINRARKRSRGHFTGASHDFLRHPFGTRRHDPRHHEESTAQGRFGGAASAPLPGGARRIRGTSGQDDRGDCPRTAVTSGPMRPTRSPRSTDASTSGRPRDYHFTTPQKLDAVPPQSLEVTLQSWLEEADATKGLPIVRGRFHGQAPSLATD